MPTVKQLKQYAEIVLEYASRSTKKLSRKQQTQLLCFKQQLERYSEQNLPALLQLNKLIAEFTVGLIQIHHQAPVRAAIINNLIEQNDSHESVLQKLQALSDFVKPAKALDLSKTKAPTNPAVYQQHKFVIYGENGVGKSSLSQRMIDNTFSEQNASNHPHKRQRKILTENQKTLQLDIWDTYESSTNIAMKNRDYDLATGIILVYDIADITSFQNIKYMVLNRKSTESALGINSVPMILVGNKNDSPESNRAISREQLETFAREHSCLFAEVSAKTGANVDQALRQLAQAAMSHKNEREGRRDHHNQPDPEVKQRLESILKHKTWHSLTSFGAGTPVGFKEILKCLAQTPALNNRELFSAVNQIAVGRANPIVKRKFFDGKRDPRLQALYEKISQADSMKSITETLESTLSEVKTEQEQLAITRRF